MRNGTLPPLVANIRDGNVTWQRLENLNYELLGYFLSCHLIIEHYLDEYLKTRYPALKSLEFECSVIESCLDDSISGFFYVRMSGY